MKKNSYIWATDLNQNSGEGILGRLYIREICSKNNNYKIETPYKKIYNLKKINTQFKIKKSFFFKYIYPILGALKVRLNAHKFQNLYYINFLPLWNFLIFIILPKNTKLGPITGRLPINKISKKENDIIIFLYKISIFIIKRKFKYIIFSTSLLKRYIKLDKDNFFFNFALILYKNFLPLKSNSKPIDILIYNRIHSNKSIIIDIKKLKLLSKSFKIYCVGDKIQISGIKNLGYQSRKKVLSFMKKSKAVVATSDNPFSFFVIDGLYNGCKVIMKKPFTNNFFDKKNFITIDDVLNIKKFKFKLNQKIFHKKNIKIENLNKDFIKFKKKFF